MPDFDPLEDLDVSALRILHYPDPRLERTAVEVAGVDERVRALVERMLELMFAGRGVGLAAPQVGVSARLFVASPSFEETDRRVYINPRIVESAGRQEAEEGCLSLPEVHCRVKRAATVTIEAMGLDGEIFRESGEDLAARIFQHESDHLDGVLLTRRMSPVARMANRKALRGLEDRFAAAK
jgi:peptide deformylase